MISFHIYNKTLLNQICLTASVVAVTCCISMLDQDDVHTDCTLYL